MIFSNRVRVASKVAGYHLLISLALAAIAAFFVFGLWYPYPYYEMSSGKNLLLIIIGVDVVCGPLLTLVLFNPKKSKRELLLDLGFIFFIQCSALIYGMASLWISRPLFLVQEIDRFKIIAAPDVDSISLEQLQDSLKPRWWKGPVQVGIRQPKDNEEHKNILFESIQGGRDFGERPEFYLPYEGEVKKRSLDRAKPLFVFLKKFPNEEKLIMELEKKSNESTSNLYYLPVMSKEAWIIILNAHGDVQGFLRGDGFE